MTSSPARRREPRSSGPGLNLGRSIRVAVSLYAVLLLGLAAALSLVTTYLHRTAARLGTAVESVRVAEALEVELMTYKDSMAHIEGAPLNARWALQARIDRLLVEAKRNAPSASEQALVTRAREAVLAYMGATRKDSSLPGDAGEGLFETAFEAIDLVLWHNVDEAREWQVRAEIWDRRADGMSVVAAVLAVVSSAALLWGAHNQVIRPLTELHDTVSAIMSGNRGARAPVRGAKELRDIGAYLNELTEALARQEHGRLVFLCDLVQEVRDPVTVLKLLPPSPAKPVIDQQLRRIERILRDVVDASLIESGELELRLSLVDLGPVVAKAVDEFRPVAPDHRFDVSIPATPVVANADSVRIEHVVRNLVSNAIKYSPAGGPVAVSLHEDLHDVEIIVADQGIGIRREDRPHIFDPAQRTGVSHEAVTGVGLGLHVTRRIVEAHGGTIEVDSTLGRGSAFRVRLPLAVPRTEKAPEDAGDTHGILAPPSPAPR